MISKVNWDALGITTSVACAIHCAVLPLLLTTLPVFGVNLIENVLFEYVMILLATIIGSYALFQGYRNHHHKLYPVFLFFTGIFFLLAKQAWHSWHLWFLVPAVISIAGAHYLNYRLCRKAGHYQSGD